MAEFAFKCAFFAVISKVYIHSKNTETFSIFINSTMKTRTELVINHETVKKHKKWVICTNVYEMIILVKL